MAALGRYELRDRLGRGGFASVYRAYDPMLKREVALKALSLDMSEEPEMRRRFMAEAQALAGLHHPNIVTVYDVGETPDRPFFTMELIDGLTLADLLATGDRLSLSQVVAILLPLADALDAIHAGGLIHRDVKAANIMVAANGRVVLMDLGIARVLDGPQYTSKSIVMLSPESAAPEQIAGRPVSAAADIYALGVVTYQMLAGRPPFVGDTSALLYAHAHEPPPPLWELRPGLPGAVYADVQEALAKDPARRPASARAFAVALRDAAGLQTAPPPVLPDSDGRWGRTRPGMLRPEPPVPSPPRGAPVAGHISPPPRTSGPAEPPLDPWQRPVPGQQPAPRPAPVEEALTAQRMVGGHEPPGGTRVWAPEPPPKERMWSRREVLGAGAGAVAVLAAIGGVAYVLGRDDDNGGTIANVVSPTPEPPTPPPPPTPTPTPPPPPPGPARTASIGTTLALTGSGAATDQPIRNGIELAVAEINNNAVPGVKIDLSLEDDMNNLATITSSFTKLIDSQNVHAIIGSRGNAVPKSAHPAAQRSGVPVLDVVNVASNITDTGDYIFRLTPTDPGLIGGVLTRLKAKLTLRRAALLYSTIAPDYTASLAEVSGALKAGGLDVVYEQTFQTGDTDFSAQLSAIKNANPDVTFIIAYSPQTAVVKAAREMGLPGVIVGGPGFNSPAAARDGGAGAEGMLVIAPWAATSTISRSQQFVRAYQARYNAEPDHPAALAYAGTYIMADAVRRAVMLDRTAIRDALANPMGFDGILGPLRFSAQREAIYRYSIQVVKNGRLTPWE